MTFHLSMSFKPLGLWGKSPGTIHLYELSFSHSFLMSLDSRHFPGPLIHEFKRFPYHPKANTVHLFKEELAIRIIARAVRGKISNWWQGYLLSRNAECVLGFEFKHGNTTCPHHFPFWQQHSQARMWHNRFQESPCRCIIYKSIDDNSVMGACIGNIWFQDMWSLHNKILHEVMYITRLCHPHSIGQQQRLNYPLLQEQNTILTRIALMLPWRKEDHLHWCWDGAIAEQYLSQTVQKIPLTQYFP